MPSRSRSRSSSLSHSSFLVISPAARTCLSACFALRTSSPPATLPTSPASFLISFRPLGPPIRPLRPHSPSSHLAPFSVSFGRRTDRTIQSVADCKNKTDLALLSSCRFPPLRLRSQKTAESMYPATCNATGATLLFPYS